MAEEHETFESADAGASLTYPMQAGTIRKNGFILIKNRPCKVRDWALVMRKLLQAVVHHREKQLLRGGVQQLEVLYLLG